MYPKYNSDTGLTNQNRSHLKNATILFKCVCGMCGLTFTAILNVPSKALDCLLGWIVLGVKLDPNPKWKFVEVEEKKDKSWDSKETNLSWFYLWHISNQSFLNQCCEHSSVDSIWWCTTLILKWMDFISTLSFFFHLRSTNFYRWTLLNLKY